MCGIAGAVATSGNIDPAIVRALHAMTDAIAHRGPDADGHYTSDRAALGHRRLSIIDISRGAQPMCNEDETVWIVFNGEIYNHKNLRKELQSKGHVFRTHSDTEAIVHGYEEWGPGVVERIEGMFGFAIFDEKAGELLVARDRLGKKPIFYAELGGALHFASEIKSLKQSPAWNGEVNTDAIEGYLNLGYVIAPGSIYTHVKKLEPGHYLRLRDGHLEVRQYWDITQFDTDTRDEPALLEELEATLRAAVLDRLESEVPLGAFLSSGIDSSLVVSLMAETLGENIRTATVGFGHKSHNELPGAQLVADKFRTQHETHIIEPSLDEVFDAIVNAFDEPFADDSAIPTYYVSKMARQFVTVALTGDGGDEAWGGYDFRYVPHAWECKMRGYLPGSLGRGLMRGAAAVWPRSSRLPRPLRLGTIFDNLALEPADSYFLDMCFIKPRDAGRLLGRKRSNDPRQSPMHAPITSAYNRCPSPSPLQKAQYGDLKTYLPNMPLVKVDRMSMLHALEIRCPLLDHRVVEMAFRIPTDRKLPNLKPKYMLRQLAQQRLPAELLSLPKQGFSAPIGKWIAGPYAQAYRDEVLSSSSRVSNWLDMDCLGRFFDEHCRGAIDRSWPLWAVWVLERWSRLGEGDAARTSQAA